MHYTCLFSSLHTYLHICANVVSRDVHLQYILHTQCTHMFNAYVYTCRMYSICGHTLWIIIVVHRLLIDNDCVGDYAFVFPPPPPPTSAAATKQKAQLWTPKNSWLKEQKRVGEAFHRPLRLCQVITRCSWAVPQTTTVSPPVPLVPSGGQLLPIDLFI